MEVDMVPSRHVLLMVCLVSSLTGGLIGSLVAPVRPVTAQDASPVAKVLSAEEFRLVDPSGQARAVLTFSSDGQPFLHFKDKNDVARISIGISSETGTSIRDVDGKTRVVLSVDDEGFPSLVVRDRNHQTNSFHPGQGKSQR
jgi:hypothetical protein